MSRGRFDRVVTSEKPTCPAGESVAEVAGGTGCRCRIVDEVIDSSQNFPTLATFCYSDPGYQSCPVWMRDKEYVWAERTNRDLLNPDGSLRVADEIQREHEYQKRLKERDLEAQARVQEEARRSAA